MTQPDAGTRRRAAGFPQPEALYDPANEHDSCGVGFIARLDAEPRHDLVEDAVRILVNLEHRGALGGDRATGDGAGLLLQMPDEFVRSVFDGELPAPGHFAVGMIFLPTDQSVAELCVNIVERVIRAQGCDLLGWRDVPTSNDHLGELSRDSQPVIRQVFIGCGRVSPGDFERRLFVMRRLIEKEVGAIERKECEAFYVCSMSSRTLLYKGMLTGTQLTAFYPDLEDERFTSCFAVVHQRYSTNTFPTWSLAQPFRMLAHNGEINTLRGNVNHMRAREADLESPLFGDDMRKLLPLIQEGGSDSAMVDNVLELLVLAGRSLPHALVMMVPEAWGTDFHMSEDKRAFYEYHASMMEPWDGPAALVMTDGRYIGAVLDRNGLRPARYTITTDGLVVMASETGVLNLAPERIQFRGRLQPGKIFLVDLDENRVVPDNEIKGKLSRQKPYRRWVADNRIELRGLLSPAEMPQIDREELRARQHAFGYTEEELKMVIAPMASRGQEAIGSMGNDAALAVLSDRPQLLFNYFKQLFAQVTNPPIDPLREKLVMSLMSFVGRERNLLAETPEHVRRLKLHHPVLTPEDMVRIRRAENPELKSRDIDILLSPAANGYVLRRALERVFQEAEDAIQDGCSLLVLTDRNMDKDHAAIPILLATAGLHHHLTRKGLRTRAGILVESGEVREVMHFATLIGYGANGICPELTFKTIRLLAEEGLLETECSAETAGDNYITAIKKGLLKTFSRMGISTIRSYFGAQIFEAVGLNSEVVEMYFTNTASRVEGAGLDAIARETVERHAKGYPASGQAPILLEQGGNYHVRRNGENHIWSPEAICAFQRAVRTGDYSLFKKFSALVDDRSRQRCTLRSLMDFRAGTSIPIEEVEPVEDIVTRFCTAAMSFGSISKEAHEAIAIAMNRLGGKSNSGEGGEDPARFKPDQGGESRRSAIKQVASGRFGVTTEYLVNADELQIKMAQGAKPGEGGHLPGHKVSPEIARVRHTTPGVSLISPPPHHDIYSIEDLAQLIYDLKCANPAARVSVKLVSEVGVGTIAAGVAKGKADMVLISGHDGGTGASPLTSIKYAGLPWELGLAETQQTLVKNRLRDRIRVQTDGHLKTGRDLAIAALLGAEEFGFGTSVLISLGCVMMRKCHMNTCPVGVATQDERLRQRFRGKPEHVVNFMRFMARELREHMARLGFRSVDEMVGRADMLDMSDAIEHWKSKGLDFSAILSHVEPGDKTDRRCVRAQDHGLDTILDKELIELAAPAIETGARVTIDMPVRNVHRAVCTMLSGAIAKKYGYQGLPEGTIDISFTGSVGQSFGAFLAAGINVRLEGDANDYVGKGMSGGRIVVVPPSEASLDPEQDIIVGNVVMYGATGGETYIHGVAGERFCVRNSGGTAVVEGVGDHGCEYMTGGSVVVLGHTGYNFAAGMSGGVAYVYDRDEIFGMRCNYDMVDLESVWEDVDREHLHDLIEKHARYTGSPRARWILDNWENQLPLFVKVMPMDYRKVLERMRRQEDRDTETVAATEEVFNG